jgi:hypothetical protein
MAIRAISAAPRSPPDTTIKLKILKRVMLFAVSEYAIKV